MPSPAAFIRGLVAKALPNALSDDQSNDKPVRLLKYGEQAVLSCLPTRHMLADEGSYVLATNPTISTGLTWVAAQTAFSDTTPNFYLYNNEAVGGKTLYLDYLKMIATAAGTAATAWHYAIIVDQVARAITTNHVLAITPTTPVSAVSLVGTAPTINAQNSATASVIAASSSASRIAARGVLGGLNVAGDEFVIVFGSTDVGAHPGLTAAQAAALSRRVDHSAAVGIGPGHSAVIHIWAPSSSASINPEFELGMFLR